MQAINNSYYMQWIKHRMMIDPGNKLCLFALFLILFLFNSCPVSGQEKQKKVVTPEDYDKWEVMNIHSISDKGNYICFNTAYGAGADTLFLRHTKSRKVVKIAKGRNGQFINEYAFVCQVPDSKLLMTFLGSKKQITIPNSIRYEIVSSGKYIVTLDKGFGEKSVMRIFNEQGELVDTTDGVTEFSIDHQRNFMLYAKEQSGEGSIGLINFLAYCNTTLKSVNGCHFHTLTWQRDAGAAGYLRRSEITGQNTLCLYRLPEQKEYIFDSSMFESESRNIVGEKGLKISNDGRAVFFGVTAGYSPIASNRGDVPEIWKADDKIIYPVARKMLNWESAAKLAVWFPESNIYRQVSTSYNRLVQLSGKQGYAVTAATDPYGPNYQFYPDGDFYITSLTDGKQKLLLEKQTTNPGHMALSPLNDYLVYYREKNWWAYNPETEKHNNLTSGINANWDNAKDKSAVELDIYGNPGWTSDGKGVLLYDDYDIWLVSLDGNSRIRVTAGRERKIKFRIAALEFNYNLLNYEGRGTAEFDLSAGLVLAATDDNWATGYYIWDKRNGEEPIIFNSSFTDQLVRSKNGSYAFREQTFEKSGSIIFKSGEKQKPTVLYQSNSHQEEYHWGKAELIRYRDSKGRELKAALFYPANYNKTKQYPMVVQIYQIMSRELHRYTNPSQHNGDGFNSTNFTLSGYFVLLPDIRYEIGNPGISASECVSAAVETVLKMGIVEKDKIGLIGHSFGGYETNFIVTHTNLFAAAVAGAGVSDFAGWYFNVGKDVEAPEIWRFESQQYRMGKSFFEDNDGYFRNSPLYNADGMTAALLSWSGKEDSIIPWEQSLSFYNALRRLGKRHLMLIYPDENHVLSNSENMHDLTSRIEQWFAHFLKGEAAEKWMQ